MVVLHGHFYQPPRDDPWLEEVEAEPSAAPFHDWNHRIEQECYRAVVAARVPGAEGRIAGIINTLEYLSFDFGPTLLEWLEREAAETYQAVLAADRASRARLGHGNAIAMPYHHTILPLSSRRDKVTEIRWGIADFRRRFGREPEGMWLPETAVDHETLEVLAAEGIKFTVLAPHQVATPPLQGMPGLYRTREGRELAVFVYDGKLSHDVAFGPLTDNAEAWAALILEQADDDQGPAVVSMATDGETYGHHHRFGEMGLAHVIQHLRETPTAAIENFASILARFPPRQSVELVSPSSWSCPHGVERWRSDCGCRITSSEERVTQQRWRAPLRDAVNWLIAELHAVFDREGERHLKDPWGARDRYGRVIGAEPAESRAWVRSELHDGFTEGAWVRAAELLELERNALRTLTSCAWFFDDIGGIEAVQVLRYAVRAIEIAGAQGPRLELGLVERLAPAVSNDHALGTGRDIYLRQAKPQIPSEARIAGGLAAAREFAPSAATSPSYTLSPGSSPATFELVHTRTGRRTPFGVEVHLQGLDVETVVASPALAQPERLRLAHLPDRQREALALVLRARVIERWFSPEERGRLSRGEQALDAIAHLALGRAVAALEGDRSDPAITRTLELLELYQSLGLYVPFDVQTRFYRSWKSDQGDGRRLAGVARALGFTVAAAESGS
jgi:hypothetical protein